MFGCASAFAAFDTKMSPTQVVAEFQAQIARGATVSTVVDSALAAGFTFESVVSMLRAIGYTREDAVAVVVKHGADPTQFLPATAAGGGNSALQAPQQFNGFQYRNSPAPTSSGGGRSSVSPS